MREEEARAVFDALAGVLRQFQLEWVVDQVRQEIATGKAAELVPRQGGSFDIIEVDVASPPSRTRGADPTTVPYTANEQVEVLTAAVSRAVIDAEAVERSVKEFFIEESESSPSVAPVLEFIPEVADSGEPTVRLTLTDLPDRSAATERLAELLGQLTSLVNDDNT